MGKAIVAHPIACEGINVKDRETVMFAESPSEFVECIKQLFSNALLRKSLGNNGRHLIEQEYSFKNIGQKLNLLCETIVKT
jgi:glycosyltransferase involved in cell wall biosynthesis